MRIITVIGARPQFVKAAMVSRAIKAQYPGSSAAEIIIHTGQHFDANMSDVFFEQLGIPQPDYNLGIANLYHGAMTGRMLEGIETLLKEHVPDWVLVYGDTNSTLAGALAATKLHVPVAHVEAGLRSHNAGMPEEINRVLTDRVSTLLFCPTATAVSNLESEGFPYPVSGGLSQRLERVGDVMLDAAQHYGALAREKVPLERWSLAHREYVLCTLHRQENTDDEKRLSQILDALVALAESETVVLPIHPRTRARISEFGLQNRLGRLRLLDPVPYLEMQRLQIGARCLLTDSGGMQKEAYFHHVPCVTLRDETEWIETVESGWNRLSGADTARILAAVEEPWAGAAVNTSVFGDGNTAGQIVSMLAGTKSGECR